MDNPNKEALERPPLGSPPATRNEKMDVDHQGLLRSEIGPLSELVPIPSQGKIHLHPPS